MRAGRRTDMNREFEVVIWPPLRLARMRRERGSVIVVLPTVVREGEGGKRCRVLLDWISIVTSRKR